MSYLMVLLECVIKLPYVCHNLWCNLDRPLAEQSTCPLVSLNVKVAKKWTLWC